MIVKSELEPLSQIADIYVYCMDEAKHNKWANSCNKVRNVSKNFGKILQMIKYDLQNNPIVQMKTSTKTPTTDFNQQDAEKPKRYRYTTDNNVWDQLAFSLLLSQSSNDNSQQQDFYDFAKNFISTGTNDNENKQCLDQLNQFIETFTPEQSIFWYTKDTFLYDILMSEMYSSDLDSLWHLRYYWTAFYTSLLDEHKKFVTEYPDEKLILYHGTHLTTSEFNLMKKSLGQTMTFNKIYSTSYNLSQALELIKSNNNAQVTPVLMEIKVDLKLDEHLPYAEIIHDNNEREILFYFGSKFRLTKMEYVEHEQYWLIGIQLCQLLDDDVKELYNYYECTLLNLNNTAHAYGKVLCYKGLFTNAYSYFRLALGAKTEQLVQVQCDLSEFYMRNGKHDRALDLHAQALDLEPDNLDVQILGCYLSILSRDLSSAEDLLEKIINEHQNKRSIAKVYIALGYIALLDSNIQNALHYFTLAKESAKKFVPSNHPDCAKNFIRMGYAYYLTNNIMDANECFENAYKLQKQCLPLSHPDIAKTYIGFARIYSANQNMKQALNYLERALAIQIERYSTVSGNHVEIFATKSDIKNLEKSKPLRSRMQLLDYI
ncbi:unnamed protein product [Didymodactylos carnosus]|uniref:Uncharacterized protein n=1 Tax=Didymodactylos carnosus TaxID=1234261 RepID=A0A8S2P218_9BILA|nr:unnamed protein product [Didymodactylos carnosus]CAF4029853.1 unnamed protein product [Didymodactylos carnosus]